MLVLKNDPFFRMLDSFFEETTDNINWKGSVREYKTNNENEYKVSILVPGLTKNDVDIIVEDGIIKISYEKDEESIGYVESFVRSYSLPDDVSEKKISASVENGVLNVVFPKIKKKNSQRTILID